jgi:hypothetical protein
MTAKTPEPPQESRPPTTAASTSPAPVPAQPAAAPTAAPAAASGTAAAAARPAGKATPVKPATKRRGNGIGGLAFVVAVIALLVAAGSASVAVYALDVAREAKSNTAATVPIRSQPTNPPSAAAATPPAAATPTPPKPQFLAELVRQELKIPAPAGCASVFVDVDTMQVGVFSGHEFYLTTCLGSPELRIDKTAGAAPTVSNPTPEVCAAQLAGANGSTELVLAVRVGLTFCLLTNKDDANRQSLPQRIGVIEVREVGGDQSVTLAVSTYRVPTQNS